MQNNLNIRGEPVQSIYSEYRQGKYIVNRRYQRKLVWTLEQKQKFIDSLINQYPVPLFLGAVFEHSSKGKCFEILDGMQRLEAITSFIDGNYHVNGKYFDLSVVVETNRLLIEGKLTQKEPKLEYEECRKLLNYPLPISSANYTSNEGIDESFRRINTGGVQLSRQEVRQAGVTSEFSQLVRKCAVYIRGDVSHNDILDLERMREISLSKDDLDYGIKIKNTFWSRNHILTVDNILASKDEELIAHMLLHILLKEKSQTSSRFLDEVYDKKNSNAELVLDSILKLGKDNIYKQFCYTFDELQKVINEFTETYHTYLYNNTPVKIQSSYQVLFLSVFELLFIQNKQIQNYRSLANALRNIASNHMATLNRDNKWLAHERARMIKAVIGIIGSHFIPREGLDPTSQSWIENLENILNQSKTESVCYDFKMGLYSLQDNTNLNGKLVSKIIKTLTAMANSHAGNNYVILGVADNKEDSIRHEKFYNSKSKSYGNFFITGINNEAIKYNKDIDTYQQKLQQLIQQEPINEEIKRLLMRNIVFFTYYDKDVVMFKIIRGKEPIRYDDKIYVRKMANNDPNPIEKNDEFKFFQEFLEQSTRYPYT